MSTYTTYSGVYVPLEHLNTLPNLDTPLTPKKKVKLPGL